MAAVNPRGKRKPMSDINVVPYIDVMLVLLIIFMVTAPLLTQGVKVELPQAASNPIEEENGPEPVVVTVSAEGDYYLNIAKNPESPIDAQSMMTFVAAVLQQKPKTQVLIRGDGRVLYEKVVQAMSLLQAAGAPTVGLITEAPTLKRKN